MSTRKIPVAERLIVALDVPSNAEALNLVDQLGSTVMFYKVGLELIIGGEYLRLMAELIKRGKKVMLDGKFFDVPATVAAAVRQAVKHQVTFATVHGNDAMLQAAAAEKGDIKILAVTALTSLDNGDLRDLGFVGMGTEQLVLSRAKRALALGCDGVVSSGLEAAALRRENSTDFLIVTPGIRPVANSDDQKRTVNVEQAFENGADYIVVGRPIVQDVNPVAAAERIQHSIASVFAVRDTKH